LKIFVNVELFLIERKNNNKFLNHTHMFNDKIREYIKKENEYDQEQIEREGNVHAREHIDHQI